MFISRKLLDLERKVAMFKPMVKSLFAENETFKNKVAILIVEAENYKECVAALEKSRGKRRILSRGGARDKQKKKKIKIRIYIVLINYQPRQISKNHVD